MTFNLGAGEMILFGGLTDSNHVLGDTWAWDGTAWKQLNYSGPPIRAGEMIAYDSARDRVVMFGGMRTHLQVSQLC